MNEILKEVLARCTPVLKEAEFLIYVDWHFDSLLVDNQLEELTNIYDLESVRVARMMNKEELADLNIIERAGEIAEDSNFFLDYIEKNDLYQLTTGDWTTKADSDTCSKVTSILEDIYYEYG